MKTTSNGCAGTGVVMVGAIVVGVLVVCFSASPVLATSVTLQNATASYEQGATGPYGAFTAASAIDAAVTDASPGWAIYHYDTGLTNAEWAAFEAASAIVSPGGSSLTFTIKQEFGNFHPIGRFLLSVTDAATPFGPGTVWTALAPLSFASAAGEIGQVLGDSSILVNTINNGHPAPDIDTYTVAASSPLTTITGFRLDAIADSTLPFDGPGRQPTNGNFVITSFLVDAAPLPLPLQEVPEPLTLLAVLMGSTGLVAYLRKRPLT